MISQRQKPRKKERKVLVNVKDSNTPMAKTKMINKKNFNNPNTTKLTKGNDNLSLIVTLIKKELIFNLQKII
jgi:hypothetical protein